MANKYGNTASNKNFGISEVPKIERSTFRRDHTHKTTLDAGDIVPIYTKEVIPGDTTTIDLTQICRKLTPLHPTMDMEELEFFAFYEKNKNLYNDWAELIGENNTSAWTNNSTVKVPKINALIDTKNRKAIGRYMGIPYNKTGLKALNVNGLGLAAYMTIYDQYFRNQNTHSPVILNRDTLVAQIDGIKYDYNSEVLKAMKKPDYFSSALPAPQKGDAVNMPINLAGLIPVVASGNYNDIHDTGNIWMGTSDDIDANGGQILGISNIESEKKPYGLLTAGVPTAGGLANIVTKTNLMADTKSTDAGGIDINALRYAMATQRILERDARGGTRYREILKAHFGVTLDALQDTIPEYLGGVKLTINQQQVPQTSQSVTNSPQANLTAYSHTTTIGKHIINKTYKEHGILMIVAVIRKRATYQQGIPKMFARTERLDYYWGALAHIGEQPIRKWEIYAGNLNNDPNWDGNLKMDDGDVWGYQEAWGDMRYDPNMVSGEMDSNYSVDGTSDNGLDEWHYADNYTAEPTYGKDWMTDNSQECISRTIDAQTQSQYILDITFGAIWHRPMPITSIPGLMDHH